MSSQAATRYVGLFAATLVSMLMGLTVFVGAAGAATFTATDAASFATAVAAANSTPGANTIMVAGGPYSPKQTAVFTNKTGPLTIQGPAPVANVNALQAKFVGSAIVPTGASLFVVNAGVTVNFVDIAAATAGSSGNPIFDDQGTINLNQVGVGGANGPALEVESNASGGVLNSTISDGLDIGVIDNGTATLTNTTITRNLDGGLDNQNGTLGLVNTIVANNDASADCTATATTSDHSLDSDHSCGVGTLSAMNPRLGSIGSSGGSTPTDVPASGSPAIGAGNASCPPLDQRGAVRPTSGCDIGAVQTDTVKPVLTTANIMTSTGNASGKPVTYTPTWTDIGAPVTSSCAPASGSTFPIGATTVTCSATDSFGNSATGTFVVSVAQNSTTPPTITITIANPVAATDAGGAIVNYTPTATDTTDGTDPVSCTPAPGTRFALGNTTVNCTSTDSVSNTATKSATVTVTDQAPPVIAVPANITAAAVNASGATVTYTAAATDNVDASDTVSCLPASASTFAIGTTTVTCTASDRAGNAATPATFTVTVVDAPTLTVSDQTAAATSAAGASVSFAATATDPVDGSVPVTCTPASGSQFAIGKATVGCTATNTAGKTTAKSFTVTVADQTPPTITVPASQALAAVGPGGTTVTYSASAADIVDGTDAVVCAPASGATFPVGQTTVTCNASDAAGNAATAASFTITVTDTAAPVLGVPAPVSAAATSAAGAVVSYSVSATDLVDGALAASCSPASGATFAVGTTTVNCTAVDKAGNAAGASFTVTVTAPPSNGVQGSTNQTPPGNTGGTATNNNTGSTGGNTGKSGSSGGKGSGTSKAKTGTATIVSAKAKGSTATVVVTCKGAASTHCAVQLELVAPGGKPGHPTVFAKKSLTLSGGRKASASLRLNAAGTAQVGKRHTVQLLLTQTGHAAVTKSLAFGKH